MDKLPDWPEKPMYDEPDEAFINYERAMKEAWEARCRVLYAAVKGHNDACVTACGVGDQAGVSCGYRPYFPRRCPTCPLYDQIYDEEGRELLDVAIGELPPA
jgi:hypothetical protein